jgi:hypothetical protein
MTGPDTVLVRAERVFERRTPGAVLLLGPRAASPLVLRGTAPAVWDAFADGGSIASVAAALARTYDVERERVAIEIGPVVEQLLHAELLAPAPTNGHDAISRASNGHS